MLVFLKIMDKKQIKLVWPKPRTRTPTVNGERATIADNTHLI